MKAISELSKVIKKNKKVKDKGMKKVSRKIKSKITEDEIVKSVTQVQNKLQNKSQLNYVLPSTYVTENVVLSCLNAVKKLTENYNNKNAIFGDEIPIFMNIRSIKIQNSRGNIKLVLPHSTILSSGEICLITPDLKKGKKVDHEPTIDKWEDLLKHAGVTGIKTILPMRQLRVEYDQFELKRRLLTLHDFIMVDNRVLNHVSHLLGKLFFKKHNMLIPVKINEKGNIKNDIDRGLRTVMLRLSEGQTSTVIIGHTGMSQNDLKDNILGLVKKLNRRFPGGELNIRSLSIKLPLSLAVPLYITLRSSNSVPNPKLKQSKPKMFVEFEGELTTKPGSIVRVAPDGTVHLKQNKKKKVKRVTEDIEE